jgi:integrase
LHQIQRGVRVVERARLESVYTGNGIAGSNPALSAPEKPLNAQFKGFFMKNEFLPTLPPTVEMTDPVKIFPYNRAVLKVPKNAAGKPDLSKKWYVEFWVWSEIEGKKVRVRREWDINQKMTVKAREEYGNKKADQVNRLLEKGLTIKADQKEDKEKQVTSQKAIHRNTLTIKAAIDRYIKLQTGSLSENTLSGYVTLYNTLVPWLEDKGLENILLVNFKGDMVEDFFNYLKLERKVITGKPDQKKEKIGVSNKTFNNYHTSLNAVINHFIRTKGIIKKKKNPLKSISKKNAESGKHIPFSQDQITKIQELAIKKDDFQFLIYIKFLYYTFGRPGKEVRLLQVKDLWTNTIFLPATRTKRGRGRHVSIPPALEEIIKEYKLRDYPKNYFLFSHSGSPGPEPVGVNYFYNKQRSMLDELGFTDQEYTLYGYKHTGNINLYLATNDIMAVFEQNGHSSLDQTRNYMRDLGMLRNENVYNKFPEFAGNVDKIKPSH